MKLWRSMTSALDLPLLQGHRTKKQAATFKFSRFAPVDALRVFLKTQGDRTAWKAVGDSSTCALGVMRIL